MMSDWLVEHSALSSTHRSNSPLLAGRNCQSQTFYKENSLLWASLAQQPFTHKSTNKLCYLDNTCDLSQYHHLNKLNNQTLKCQI